MRLEGPTLLPTTLLADLQRLDTDPQSADVIEVIAACLRHREAALLCIEHDGLVWPITLFPNEGLYHSPRDMREASISGLAQLRLATAEPAGVKPPGHWKHERVAQADHYRPLPPLLWWLALNGPRKSLLADIAGPAAYRLVNGSSSGDRPSAPGALGSAMDRLRQSSMTLAELARCPGMSNERASRLLNGLYFTGCLLTTRTQMVSRGGAASAGRGLFGWMKSR